MTKSIFICLFLTSCTYRYGTRSFVVDNRTTELTAPTAEPYPMEIPADPPAVVTKQVTPCKIEKTEKLVVTNHLDSKNNTIVTTAVSTRTEDKESSCKE
jgi:hypothetical protein